MRRSFLAIALLALGCTGLARAAAAPEAGDGTTPLHWAVYNGDAEQVRSLIKSGADVNARNDYGSTPLTEAAETGNVDIIGQLLKAGADPQSSNDDGQTALMILARTSNTAAADLLLKHRAKVNAAEKWRGQTALMWAAAEQQPDMVKLLIRHGADVNARSTVNDWKRYVTAEGRKQDRNPGGFTPLLYAARQGCVECARALLKGGAKVNLADPDGITPLLMAVMSMHFDTAKLLIESGANPRHHPAAAGARREPRCAAAQVPALPRARPRPRGRWRADHRRHAAAARRQGRGHPRDQAAACRWRESQPGPGRWRDAADGGGPRRGQPGGHARRARDAGRGHRGGEGTGGGGRRHQRALATRRGAAGRGARPVRGRRRRGLGLEQGRRRAG